MADPGKLSPSKITTYLGCSFAYCLHYILHEWVPDNVRLAFGKKIHWMLDNVYDLNFKTDESFASSWCFHWRRTVAGDNLKEYEKNKIGFSSKEYEYTGRDEEGRQVKKTLKVGNHIDLGPNPLGTFFAYRTLGVNILKRFYNRHMCEKNEKNKKRNPPIARELAFGVRNDEPIEIAGHLIRGVFDRIDRTDMGCFITDYKTDKSSPGRNSFVLHRNIQFTIYSMVFRQIFQEQEKAILYYHLRSGDVFKTYRSERDFEYVKRLLDKVAKGIEDEDFVPFYGFHCEMCDRQSVCEKYSHPYHGGPRIDLEGKIIGAEKFDKWDVDAQIPDWMEDKTEER